MGFNQQVRAMAGVVFCAASVFAWAQNTDSADGRKTAPAPASPGGGGGAGAANTGADQAATPAPPAAETGALPDERRLLDPSALPGIAIERDPPGGAATRPRQDGRDPDGAPRAAVEQLRAQNWLLDGVRRREAETELRRRAMEAGSLSPDDTAGVMQDWTEAETQAWLLTGQLPESRRQSTAGRASAAAGAAGAGRPARANAAGAEENPFSAYLANWLTPADYALLNSGAGGAPASGGARVDAPARPAAAAPSFVPEKAAGASAGVLAAGMLDAGIFDLSALTATANNPFVEDIFAPILTTPAPGMISPPPPAPGQAALPRDIGNPAFSAPADKVIKPSDITTPPTESIINDKKYFPQLNRF